MGAGLDSSLFALLDVLNPFTVESDGKLYTEYLGGPSSLPREYVQALNTYAPRGASEVEKETLDFAPFIRYLYSYFHSETSVPDRKIS
uniref:Uncharacterized protein n=1 Tax=Chromera velia CCMP2878 TaxID=1169474 RepID=A0A0G4GCM0_9ALVE|eukprot:Cvel_4521.t1-p1 / transcript=Cvel_4521.t1 / gene=Cvel_4521 / organism=Chromera_velia_CCMP2878 / gene_product=hypothetical protein / transcript_product=hypothetical protein / location=Cvel_scaffold198:22094-22354(+) / protein_length=87 / sequence_SO=supercontig / SO=protein_coding / is_pseudo=false